MKGKIKMRVKTKLFLAGSYLAVLPILFLLAEEEKLITIPIGPANSQVKAYKGHLRKGIG
jgi:hypothetical protein